MEIAELVLEYVKVLVWPVLVMIIVLIFRKQLYTIIYRIEKASLPGGVSLILRQEVREAKQLSDKIEAAPPSKRAKNATRIPLTEVNARLLSLGLQPSPSGFDGLYYRNLAIQDPNLALAGLRIEVDITLKNLAKGFNVKATSGESSRRLAKRLHESNAISSEQMQLINKILSIGNLAVHGSTTVTFDEAISVIDAAEVVVDEYIAWLSWGFADDWKPSD